MLVDFGIARDARSGDRPPTGALGTPRFAAPEVLAGGAASPRSDVYGLAATLWALIAGEPPQFLERGLSGRATARGLARARRRRWRAALEPDPHLRLQSAEAFARALGEGVRADRGASLSLSRRAAVRRPCRVGDDRPVRRGRVRRRRGLDRVLGCATTSCTRPPGEREPRRSSASGWSRAPASPPTSPRPAGPEAIASCRDDSRFAHSLAESTGYVPNTMLVLPLGPAGRPFGVLQILDRLDGEPFGTVDLDRGAARRRLALTALDMHDRADTQQEDTL